jgi:hypothetical protein
MRRKPYTDRGIRRVPCSRCGRPSLHQWQACADGGVFRGCCAECDVGLNKLVLEYMRLPNRQQKLRDYARKVLG